MLTHNSQHCDVVIQLWPKNSAVNMHCKPPIMLGLGMDAESPTSASQYILIYWEISTTLGSAIVKLNKSVTLPGAVRNK